MLLPFSYFKANNKIPLILCQSYLHFILINVSFKFMQIILIKPVRKLGKVGGNSQCKNGYGWNFLVPQGIAIRATKDNLGKFAALQKNLKKKHSRKIKNGICKRKL